MSDEDLIARLETLTPAAAIDPLAIAFEAGRRSARASVVRWRVATAAVGAAALLALAVRVPIASSPSVAPTVAPVAAIEPPPVVLPPQSMIALRDAVLDRGLDGVATPPRTGRRERTMTARG